MPELQLPHQWRDAVCAIHDSGRQIVLAVTGGGTGAIAALLQTPGASRTMLEAVVPYSLPALAQWIGGKPDQACSAATARAMAMTAFMRARQWAPAADQHLWLGVAASASLASDRPKRGRRRLWLAAQRCDRTWEAHVDLDDSPAIRTADEYRAAHEILSAVVNGCDLPWTGSLPASAGRSIFASNQDQQLLLGGARLSIVGPGRLRDYLDSAAAARVRLLLPGAFNPPHRGHLAMIEIAEKRAQCDAVWELSIQNVDKPPLDYISIDERLAWIRQLDAKRWIARTCASTFREKSELFPNATFIVGVDTLIRIADPRYYGGDHSQRDAAIGAIASRGCRFLAFGRVLDGKFAVLSDFALPSTLKAICDEVSGWEFREDISSTELRRSVGEP
jgi:hypothetical protein